MPSCLVGVEWTNFLRWHRLREVPSTPLCTRELSIRVETRSAFLIDSCFRGRNWRQKRRYIRTLLYRRRKKLLVWFDLNQDQILICSNESFADFKSHVCCSVQDNIIYDCLPEFARRANGNIRRRYRRLSEEGLSRRFTPNTTSRTLVAMTWNHIHYQVRETHFFNAFRHDFPFGPWFPYIRGDGLHFVSRLLLNFISSFLQNIQFPAQDNSRMLKVEFLYCNRFVMVIEGGQHIGHWFPQTIASAMHWWRKLYPKKLHLIKISLCVIDCRNW